MNTTNWKLLCTNYKDGVTRWQSFENIKNPFICKTVYYDINGKITKTLTRNYKRLVNPESRDKFQDPGSNSAHTTYKCPNCGCTIHLDWHEQRNYCPTCGIKLDWREVHKEI